MLFISGSRPYPSAGVGHPIGAGESLEWSGNLSDSCSGWAQLGCLYFRHEVSGLKAFFRVEKSWGAQAQGFISRSILVRCRVYTSARTPIAAMPRYNPNRSKLDIILVM